jgi:hypothetical protein
MKIKERRRRNEGTEAAAAALHDAVVCLVRVQRLRQHGPDLTGNVGGRNEDVRVILLVVHLMRLNIETLFTGLRIKGNKLHRFRGDIQNWKEATYLLNNFLTRMCLSIFYNWVCVSGKETTSQ